MRYVFDLDGTLCTPTDGSYETAKPIASRIAVVNNLYHEGHHITIYTARGMGRHNNDRESAIAEFEELTKKQLEQWEISFHELVLGKVSGDVYVDDKGSKDTSFFCDQSPSRIVESKKRSLLKAVSWRVIAVLNSYIVLTFALSTNLRSAIAMNVTGFFVYFLFERIFSKINFGRTIT